MHLIPLQYWLAVTLLSGREESWDLTMGASTVQQMSTNWPRPLERPGIGCPWYLLSKDLGEQNLNRHLALLLGGKNPYNNENSQY